MPQEIKDPFAEFAVEDKKDPFAEFAVEPAASEAGVEEPAAAQFVDDGFAQATLAVDAAEDKEQKAAAAEVGPMDALSVNIIDNLTLGNYDEAMPAIATLLEDIPAEKQKELYKIRQKAVTDEYPMTSKVGEILGEALALVGGVKGAKMLYKGGKSAAKSTAEIYKKVPKEVKDFVISTIDAAAVGSPRSGYYAMKHGVRLGGKALKAGKNVLGKSTKKKTTADVGKAVERIAKSKGKKPASSKPTSIKTKDVFKTQKKSTPKAESTAKAEARTPARQRAREKKPTAAELKKAEKTLTKKQLDKLREGGPYSDKQLEVIRRSRKKGMTGY